MTTIQHSRERQHRCRYGIFHIKTQGTLVNPGKTNKYLNSQPNTRTILLLRERIKLTNLDLEDN